MNYENVKREIDSKLWDENGVAIPAVPAGVNPKDLIGATKIDLALIPQSALIACALAFSDGASKYGAFNWREKGKPVQARTYVSANGRHVGKWFDGEELDPETKIHHLGYAMACCAILIDAQACGNMADNRPPGGTAAQAIADAEAVVAFLAERARARANR